VNGGLAARVRLEQHALSLRWAREDVETVAAMRAGLRQDVAAAGWALRTPRWRADAELAWRVFDDGNHRGGAQATLLRLVGRGFEAGASAAFDDSRFDPAEYYAPRGLSQLTGRVAWRSPGSAPTALQLDAGGGGAWDPASGLRPAAAGQARLTRWWGSGRRLATSLRLSARAVPGYASAEGTFRLEGRL
jgi:hypothetical protein